MTDDKQFMVLVRMNHLLGPKATPLFKEHMRQLSIWAQVQAYQADYCIQPKGNGDLIPLDEMQKITRRYPEVMVLMSQFVEASAAAYRHTRDAGNFADKTGRTFLDWSLKTFGRRMP